MESTFLQHCFKSYIKNWMSIMSVVQKKIVYERDK